MITKVRPYIYKFKSQENLHNARTLTIFPDWFFVKVILHRAPGFVASNFSRRPRRPTKPTRPASRYTRRLKLSLENEREITTLTAALNPHTTF